MTTTEAPPKLDLLQLAAFHEVGHLVTAHALGLKCSWLRIRRHILGSPRYRGAALSAD